MFESKYSTSTFKGLMSGPKDVFLNSISGPCISSTPCRLPFSAQQQVLRQVRKGYHLPEVCAVARDRPRELSREVLLMPMSFGCR